PLGLGFGPTAFGGGPGFRGGGLGLRGGDVLGAAATYLGLTAAQLQAQLQSGKSLGDVAKAQGKSVSGLESAIVSAFQSKLDQAVAAGKLTSAQRDQILSNFKSRIDDFVNRTPTAHPPGAFGGGYRFAPGGSRLPFPAEKPQAFLPTA
ncbi:MAG TPA: hypothetical protein VLJ76_08750, partial [Gaiellaceae bacterium]|nr:hypothetical protein [Gaiellaceae bacterium]